MYISYMYIYCQILKAFMCNEGHKVGKLGNGEDEKEDAPSNAPVETANT